MEGRGKYWFYGPSSTAILYVGEVSENLFQGLGKMIFKDGSQYFGSFLNNQINTKKGLICFNNGDKFKGQIERGQRNGPGEYEYSATDGKRNFQGGFKDDLREGSSVLSVQTDLGVIKYSGDYQNDKRHGKCDELSLTDSKRQKQACFRGELDQNEELSGVGQIDLPQEDVFY